MEEEVHESNIYGMSGTKKVFFIIAPPVLGILAKISGSLLDFDFFRSMIFGIAITCLICIIEIGWVISEHDKIASRHYEIAMNRYNEIRKMGQKLLMRALDDVESLILYIEADMRKVFGRKELTERSLLVQLVKLDLGLYPGFPNAKA